MKSSFISTLFILTACCLIAVGQTPKAPPAPKPADAPSRALAFNFGGDGGYLGVQTEEVSKENFAKLGLREVRGVAIEKVIENSPAAAAGLRDGDVIVRFNGDEVTSSRKLTRLVGEVDPDHQVRLTITRGGSEQEIIATIGKTPMPKFGDGGFTFSMPPDRVELPELAEKYRGLEKLQDLQRGQIAPPPGFNLPNVQGDSLLWRMGQGRQIGVSIYPVTKQMGATFGVDGGVMVNNVAADSPAAKAGLKAGDIIVEIDGKPVKNNLDLIKSISEKKEGDVQVTVVRDRSRQTLNVTPEASKDGGFFYQTDNDNGLFAPMPGRGFQTAPSWPRTPMIAPRPMTQPAFRVTRPGRVI